MRDDVAPGQGTDGIEGLNALLSSELAAVSAYEHALRAAESRGTADAAAILRFASEHQRTVAALQGAVRELGGVPSSELATSGAFALLRDTGTLRELLAGEESSLLAYESASGILGGDEETLVTTELIPRQRRHIAGLTAILSRLIH
jgi:bacterioferritin (cytochrome b1)